METNINISKDNCREIAGILNRLLSDEYVLYTKTRGFHWNVTGPHFSELHKFFEGQYEQLAGIVDDVAERTRSLGERPYASLAEFLKATRIREASSISNGREMIAGLLADHESIVRTLRQDLTQCIEKFGDAGTSDFLTGLMESHEKMAWMLRAQMEG